MRDPATANAGAAVLTPMSTIECARAASGSAAARIAKRSVRCMAGGTEAGEKTFGEAGTINTVRRAIAAVLFLQAVALAGGLGLVRAGKSCCCAKKSGATCPMRARCDAGKCSLDSSTTPAVDERSIPAVIETAFRLEPRRGARG